MIIALDTSTSFGGVAIVKADKLIAECTLNVKKTHSERLMSSLEWLMAEADVTLDQITGIACGVGPGSFTGVRIAVSAAKCLAYARRIPLVGVCSLDALAYDCRMKTVAMIDARHERAFSATFVPHGANSFEIVGEYCLESVKNIVEEAIKSDEKVVFTGDGAVAYREIIEETAKGKAIFVERGLSHVRPANIGLLGARYLDEGRVSDIESLVPFYLRESEPEIKRKREEV